VADRAATFAVGKDRVTVDVPGIDRMEVVHLVWK
jgi:hypothetical protein